MTLNLKNLNDWGVGSASSYCKLWIKDTTAAVIDIVGSRTLTISDTPTIKTAKDGQLYRDYGTTSFAYQYGDMGTDLNLKNQPFTISVWFNRTSTPAACGIIGMYEDNNNFLGVEYYTGSPELDFECYSGGSWINISKTTTLTIPLNTWIHIVIARESSTSSPILYINGIRRTEFARTSGSDSFTCPNMSRYHHAVVNYAGTVHNAGGGIRNSMLFKGIALTAGQVKALYNATYIE